MLVDRIKATHATTNVSGRIVLAAARKESSDAALVHTCARGCPDDSFRGAASTYALVRSPVVKARIVETRRRGLDKRRSQDKARFWWRRAGGADLHSRRGRFGAVGSGELHNRTWKPRTASTLVS